MIVATLTAFVPSLLLAALDVAPATGPTDPVHIAGGQQVNNCGWPSVVLLRGNGFLCSGNLIHPEIVATAAHCLESMGDDTRVYFGNSANSSQQKVDVDFCMGSPDFVGNGDGTIAFSEVQNDWGFCKLQAPITDVEPIPPIFGCELDNLVEGAEITRVGYGKETLNTNVFLKRFVETSVVSIPFMDDNDWPAQLSEGGGGEGTCPGDSGGPAFIRIPGGAGAQDTWRMIAIQSTQPLEDVDGNPIECGDQPNNTAVIAQGLAFIEQESGVDVTPCYDVTDATWDPTYECREFAVDPGLGGGSWNMGCETGPLGGFEESCGQPFDELFPDSDPPLIAIVDPPADLELDYPGAPIDIHVLAEASDGPEGWGVARVELVIVDAAADMELARFEDLEEAYEWDPAFPQGEYLIQAIAYDNAGLIAETDTLTIRIGVEPEGTADDGSTGSSTGVDSADGGAVDEGDGTGGGTGGDSGSQSGGEGGGCGCRAHTPGTWSSVILLGLLGLRRRR